MSSYEEKYYLKDAGFLRRFIRDVRLFIDSAGFLLLWFTRGRKVRAAYRQAEKGNSTLILEEILEDKKE